MQLLKFSINQNEVRFGFQFTNFLQRVAANVVNHKNQVVKWFQQIETFLLPKLVIAEICNRYAQHQNRD